MTDEHRKTKRSEMSTVLQGIMFTERDREEEENRSMGL